MQGKVLKVTPIIKEDKLKICGMIETADKMCIEAYLPAREMAAFLPREILLGDQHKAGRSLLTTIGPLIQRLAGGRTAKLWSYEEQYYFAFLPWTGITFESGPATAASGFRTRPLHSGSV